MPVAQLKEFLDKEGVKYVSIIHSRAYTAQETAESAHIPGKQIAKTVMVKIDGDMAMAVLPASEQVDRELLRGVAGAEKVVLASEKEFSDLFSECELGAMPPFGNIYGMDVFVEEDLEDEEKFIFNAGSHSELVQLDYDEFKRLVNPNVVRLSRIYS